MKSKAKVISNKTIPSKKEPKRQICEFCLNPLTTCFCKKLKPFYPGAKFVILIHPRERKKKVGTARLLHLNLKKSELFEGIDFTNDQRVNNLLKNNEYFPLVMYPGKGSTDVSAATKGELQKLIPSKKRLLIFMIDASWSLAKKMMKLSKNLHDLTRIYITPLEKSSFRIRLQPDPLCLSTLEAADQLLSILGKKNIVKIDSKESKKHLMVMFNEMIEKQLNFAMKKDEKAYRKKQPKHLRDIKPAKKWEKRPLFFNSDG